MTIPLQWPHTSEFPLYHCKNRYEENSDQTSATKLRNKKAVGANPAAFCPRRDRNCEPPNWLGMNQQKNKNAMNAIDRIINGIAYSRNSMFPNILNNTQSM